MDDIFSIATHCDLYLYHYASTTNYFRNSSSSLQSAVGSSGVLTEKNWRKMLCRKKLVLALTLACLGLLYVSANHYLSNSDTEQTSTNDQLTASDSNSNGLAFLLINLMFSPNFNVMYHNGMIFFYIRV